MNSEESRLRTFANWPDNAVVDARRIATAGFYYMGQGQEVQCFSCGGRISEWSIGDSVMGRHRALDRNCPFVQNPVLSGNIPLFPDRRNSPNTSQDNRSELTVTPTSVTSRTNQAVFHNERARLETFAAWPISTIVSPELLAKSGFYYTQYKDKVRCVFCNGVVEKWELGDDPDTEHMKHFPNCSFIKTKKLAEMTFSFNSGVSIRHSSLDSTDSGNGSFETLKNLGVQDHRLPKHPKYSTYDSRLNTFSQWPPSLNQKPHDLAKAGFFFTGRGDQVRCFHCDGGLRLWEREDDPWLEHARWFPSCGFILLVKGQEFVDETNNIPSGIAKLTQSRKTTRCGSPPRRTNPVSEQDLQELMNSPNVVAALQMGIDSSRIKQALRHRMEYVGAPFPTPDALVVAALEAQTEQISMSECDYWSSPPESPGVGRWRRPSSMIRRDSVSSESESEQDERMEESESQRNLQSAPPPPPPQVEPEKEMQTSHSEEKADNVPLSLEEENRRLKEARMCKICMDSEVVVVFLPCRHLVTCPNCAPNLADCPVCREPIKATVRTFLS